MVKRKCKDSYECRLQMAKMHDEFLERLENAIKDEQYVEASWICYAIFEQRVHRLIEKHISNCPKQKRAIDEAPISISTKIDCISKLCKTKYGAYADFDTKLLREMKKWCKQRNALVHSLLSINTYRKYDRDFKELANDGVELVKQLYSEATKVRNWYNAGNQFGIFPEMRCRCSHRCIYEE